MPGRLSLFTCVIAGLVLLPALNGWATAPATPKLLSVTPTSASVDGARGFLLQWEDNSSDEDFFMVYARQGTTGAFGRVTETTAPNVTSRSIISDKIFTVGTTWQFVVTACKGKFDEGRNPLDDKGGLWSFSDGDWFAISESSALSNIVTITWPAAASTFAAPTNLVVTAVDDGHLKFVFTDNSDQEDRYELQLKLGSDADTDANWKTLKTWFNLSSEYFWPFNLSTNTLAISLSPSVSYDFRIRALRRTSTSGSFETTAWSNNASITFPALLAPTHFQAVSDQELTINFSWDDNSFNETNYLLQYRTVGGNFDSTGQTATLAAGTNAKGATLFPFVEPGTPFEWRVVAARQTGTDANNKPVYVLSPTGAPIQTVTTAFHAPTDLAVTVDDDAGNPSSTVTLTWIDHSLVESGFEILYSTTTLTDQSLGTVSAKAGSGGTASVTLSSGFPAGQNVTFAVRALVTSSPSNVYSDRTNSATVATKNVITSDLHPAITKDAPFTLAGGGAYTLTTSLDSSITSTSVTGLPAGLSYNDTTRVISGTPTVGGAFFPVLSATFGDGKTASATLQLRITTPPAPPIKPVTISARTIAKGKPVYISLSEMFADPDSDQAVELTLKQGSTGAEQKVNMILYRSLTPETVRNFLNYALAGDYNGTAFHRAATISHADPSNSSLTITYPFVVQGGGFKSAPETGNPLVFAPVLERSSPNNEPGIANLRGTIALAKKGGDPNSGTHDFFFNLDDRNSTDPDGAQLDSQNGGFTVFGRVAGTAMADVIDPVYALQKGSYTLTLRDPRGGATSSQGPFADWPVTGASAPSTIDPTRLVTIQKVVPIDVLKYSTPTSSASGIAVASIVDGKLKIEGLATGSSNITITATDLDGGLTAQSFTVTVADTFDYPVITQHPLNQSINEGDTATFTVTATGDGVLSYAWSKDGVALQNITTGDGTVITGADTATLTLTGVHISDLGSYSATVSNEATSTTSNPALLSFKTPVIVTQPVSPGTVSYGVIASFLVSATGTPPLTYQWRKDGTNIPGATSRAFSIGATAASAGTYTVRVTSGTGDFTDSAGAVLAVNSAADDDHDGLTNAEEIQLKLNPANADTDGDGYNDSLEIELGSNAALPGSTPASKYAVATQEVTKVLGDLRMRRILGGTLPDRLNGDTPRLVNPFWLATTELTNRQFAAVLQYAISTMPTGEKIDIIAAGSGYAVRYPAGTGNTICYLAGYGGDSGTDIQVDSRGTTFLVPLAKASLPVRAVSWEGAYLAAKVFNHLNSYTGKTPGTWSFSDASDGYYLPGYVEWEAAARGLPTASFPYPTGNTISASLAWFGQVSATAGPRNVGSYTPSLLGCYDLGGNVAEWVQDKDIPSGEYYIRGGSYADSSGALLNEQQSRASRSTIDKHVGIRLALKAPGLPTITKQPVAKLLRTDESLELTTTATGAPPITAQWYRNNVALSGKTAATLSIPKVTLGTAGVYKARLTSSGVNPVDTTAVPVSVVEVPAKTSYIVGTPSDLSLSVRATAATGHTLTYAWYKNGTLITPEDATSYLNGVTTKTLNIKIGQPTDTAEYVCLVGVAEGNAPSVAISFAVRVQQDPQLTSPPVFPKAAVGQSFVYQPDYNFADTRLPTRYDATGLPAGLTINHTTGLISGKPTVGGTFNVVIKVTNAEGVVSTSSTTLVVQKLEIAQPNAIGRFFGIVRRNSGIAPDPGLNDGLGGLLDLTTTKAATFTGRLLLGPKTYPFSGSLNATYKDPNLALPPNPTASVLIQRKGDTPLLLQFEIAIDNSQGLTGTLYRLSADGSVITASTGIIAARSAWNATTKPAIDYSGMHNIVLDISTGRLGDASAPQGSGFSTVSVSTAGATRWAGKLPDGTAFTFSGMMGAHGEHPIYTSLYAGRGSLLGEVTEAALDFHYFSGVDGVSWVKKAQTTAVTDRIYVDGIGIGLTPAGGLYHAASTGTVIMGLPVSTGPANAQLIFSEGGLPGAPLTQDLVVKSPSATVITGTTTPPSLTSVISNSTGNVSGKFTLADGRSTTYQALVVPDAQNFGKGFARGWFKLPGLPTSTAPILSGRVDLRAKP